MQSGHHKEYVFHLYEIFKNYTTKAPKEYTFKDERFPGKIYTRWSFYTTFQDCFRFYAHQFYADENNLRIPCIPFLASKVCETQRCKRYLPLKGNMVENMANEKGRQEQKGQTYNNIYKRRKTVPKLIHKWLTPRAIAYWYMDDGAQKWKIGSLGVRFCTDSFTLSEIDRLSLVLREKYLFKTSIQKKGKTLRIYVSSDSYVVLKDLIFAFLIPTMTYKFPVVCTTQGKESK